MRKWGTLVALLGALALFQCGETKVVSSSESHFLQRCEADSECGSLECLCGICSLPCENAADCSELGASVSCEQAEESCEGLGSAENLCLARCDELGDCQEISPELVCEGEICVSPSPGSLDLPCRSFYEVRLGAPTCNDELACTALPTTLETGGPTCRATCANESGCPSEFDCNFGLCIPLESSELCSSDLIAEGERALTPRSDIHLEQLALTLSDGIVADQEVYDRLVRDVGQIRMEYPEVQAITYDGPEATSLTLEVDEDTLNDMEHGRYSDWNCLNRTFRARDFDFVVFSSGTSVLFYFDGVYDQERLVDAYAALPKVAGVYVESEGGTGSTICLVRDADTWHYVFDEGGGDCPSGCTTHDYYYFRVDADGDVVSGGPWVIDEGSDPPAAPDWVGIFEEAGFPASPYSFCR